MHAYMHLDSSCCTKFTPCTNFQPIGRVRQALRSTLTESTANDHTSGIPPEISLGIHHKGPDLSLNSITPLSTCEMRPGWIWSFLLWLVDETMWEISPENWEGFTRAPQTPALQHGYLLFGCLSPELGSCRRGEGRLGTSLPHVSPSSQWARAERGCPAPGAPRPQYPSPAPVPVPVPEQRVSQAQPLAPSRGKSECPQPPAPTGCAGGGLRVARPSDGSAVCAARAVPAKCGSWIKPQLAQAPEAGTMLQLFGRKSNAKCSGLAAPGPLSPAVPSPQRWDPQTRLSSPMKSAGIFSKLRRNWPGTKCAEPTCHRVLARSQGAVPV